ncbi:threonine/homoserine efflux transporter RhtA [Anseongella ginsenosidimutans]|uniref:Threonine/homoserine efflux transporter RhtA n=1 Tax=Anseongella ginsenosidimutans TaxID=496056 RepID=A0A4R3KVP0_9SPHI|nr:DMT family transporter [Anseongella ginsenosidimutans]QEC51662.1 EamA family transporter [Anseongella ginsenosidimutans]TCS89004.1 threonine/homoserine efflux transporter RhtA [Anseongella ginsenosidimutans]
MNKDLLKGILFVSAGAASYGVLATIVRLAYNEGYTTAEATVSQYTTGLLVMGFSVLFSAKARRAGGSGDGVAARPGPASARPGDAATEAGKSDAAGNRSYADSKSATTSKSTAAGNRSAVFRLIAGGTAYGLTGVCYYLSVRYIPVSICVILLMQAIWMGIVLDALLERKFPALNKCVAVIVILAGTLLATNAIGNFHELDLRGIIWGIGAALTYTVSLFVANRMALQMHPRQKSFWILIGGTTIILLIWSAQLFSGFQFSIFGKWGLLLALFGTILPPLLLNTGMPKTGIGLGSILISIEIPVSVGSAYLLLNEQVLAIQWAGIVLIIAAIILLNLSTFKKEIGSG